MPSSAILTSVSISKDLQNKPQVQVKEDMSRSDGLLIDCVVPHISG